MLDGEGPAPTFSPPGERFEPDPDNNRVMGTTALPSAQPPPIGVTAMNDTGSIDGPEAFRQFFGRTYPAIVAYARRRVPADQVDDVVSEVYTTAWRRRTDLDPGQPALPWLYGVAANAVRNLRRTDARRLRLVGRLEAEPTERLRPDPSDRPGGELREAMQRLPFDDQEVLRLVAWEGLSHAEAGQLLGCSTNAVGIRIHRARQKLEHELNQLPGSELNEPKDQT